MKMQMNIMRAPLYNTLFMNAKRCVICTINRGNWVVQQGMHYQFEIYVCIAI
jgi:hypothetical protein